MILVLVVVVKNLKNAVEKTFKLKIHGFITIRLKGKYQYTTIDAFDEIFIEPLPNKKKVILNIEGKYSKNIPNNNLNTIYKAISKFYEIYNVQTGFKINVIKNIPKNSGFHIEESHYANILLFLHNFFDEPLEIKKYKNLKNETIQIINFYKNKNNNFIFDLPKKQEIIFFPEYIINDEILKNSIKKKYFYKLTDFKRYFSNIIIFENNNYDFIFSRFFDIYKKFEFILKNNPYAIALSDNGSSLVVYTK